MNEENTIKLTLEEVLILKEWFRFIPLYSRVEERDKELVNKLAKFEIDMYLKKINEDER